MRKFTLLMVVLALSACANPYSKFYKGLDTAQALPGYVQSNEPLHVFASSDFKKDVATLATKGYLVVGYSAFTAPSNQNSDGPMREQAAKLGAHAVLVSSKYSHTVSGAVPITTPTTATSYTTGTATAYGRGGVVNAYGNSTTTYGTQTNMIPYSIERSEFGAVFLAKTKGRLGVLVAALDDATRKRLETNQGVIVQGVVEGTPAFAADIIPGDVLLKIGADAVQSPEHFTKSLLDKYQGQAVNILLDRNGKTVEKTVTLNKY
jgi:hypothetical protein